MKTILMMSLLFTSISCSWKKDANNTTSEQKNVLSIDRAFDPDGDLLLDDEESMLGTNPLEANIPELKVYHTPMVTFSLRLEKDGAIKSVKIDSSSSERDIRVDRLLFAKTDRVVNRIAKLHLRELQNDVLNSSDMFETFEDNISVIPIKDKAMFEYLDYKNQGYKIKDGYVYVSFQLEAVGLKAVTKIDKITFSIGTISDESKFNELFYFPELYNPNGTPAILENFGDLDEFKDGRIFKTALNAMSGSKIEEVLSRRQSLAIMFNDFTVTRHNKTYSYKNLKDTISSSNAYVLLKTGDSYKRIITPYKKSLEDILSEFHKDIRYDSSLNITSIDNYGSTMVFPINVDILSAQNIDNGNWRIIAPERTIKSIPLTKTVTLVSYSTVSEFLNNLKKANADKPVEFLYRDKVEMGNINNNDEIQLELFETVSEDGFDTHNGQVTYKVGEVCADPFIDDSVLKFPDREICGADCRRNGGRCRVTEDVTATCNYRYNTLKQVTSVTNKIIPINEILIKSQDEFYPITTFMDDPEDYFYNHLGRLQVILRLQPKIINEGILTVLKKKKSISYSLTSGWISGCSTNIHANHNAQNVTGYKNYHLSGTVRKLKTNYKEM